MYNSDMKRLSRTEFFKQPVPCLFMKEGEEALKIAVKFNTWSSTMKGSHSDFIYANIGEPEHTCSMHYLSLFEDSEAVKTQSAYQGTGRDGLYDNDEMYLVYDQEDIITILKDIMTCLPKDVLLRECVCNEIKDATMEGLI